MLLFYPFGTKIESFLRPNTKVAHLILPVGATRMTRQIASNTAAFIHGPQRWISRAFLNRMGKARVAVI